MKSVICILLFTIMVTDAFGGPKLPDEYQADSIGSLVFGSEHEIFYVSGKNTRWQNGPGDDATWIYISNAKENVTYEIDVPNKMYKVAPYRPRFINDSLIKLAHKQDKDKEAHLEFIGTETVDGQFCDHFRLTSRSTTSFHYEYDYWVSKIYGVPIKIIHSSGNSSAKQNTQTKNELFIKPGHQSSDLFVLPAGFQRKEMVAFATVGSKSIHSQELTGTPEAIHTALCEDQKLHKIRYVERHLAKLDCNEPSCRHDESFDRFEFVENPLTEGMCLIGDDDFFRGKSILKFSDNVFPEDSHQRPECDDAVIKALEKAKGLAVKGCWKLGRFEKEGSFNIAEFVEHDNIRSAGLSLYDGSRLVLNNWTVKTPTESAPDVWRLGDGGIFHPDENFILFGLRRGEEIELVTVGYGGEGINYYLNLTNGNAFIEILHEYIYTAGY